MKTLKKLQVLGIIYLIFLFISSCTSDSGAGKDFSIDFEKYTMENGLQIVLHHDDSDPIVAIAITYHVGSAREKVGKTGFAHFFEHMLFQNSENVGKGQFFKIIDDLGGTFNGGTGNDRTVYFEVVPKDALEKMLWMESDRMGFLINTVTEAGLEKEKDIVINEKRQMVDNRPYGHTSYVLGKALYPDGHPYNWQVIGSMEDLRSATIDDVKEFYNFWYPVNNATLVIAGDFEIENAKELLEKYFGEFEPRGEIISFPKTNAVVETTRKIYHVDNFAKLPELTMVFPTVEQYHDDAYPLDILGELLSDGKSAAFYKKIVEEKKLAPYASSYNSSQEIAGTFRIRVRAFDGIDLDQVEEAIFEAMEEFEKEGVIDKDLERIKNMQETYFYNGMSSILGKAFQLGNYNTFGGDPGYITKDINKILAVTKDDIMRVYEKYIKAKNYIATSFVPREMSELALEESEIADVVEEMVTATAGPGKPVEYPEEEVFEKTPSKIDRTIEPPLGETPALPNPEIWTESLDNGIKVYGIEHTELPLIQFSIRMIGGQYLDDFNKPGVANLITDIMMEGTKNKTPEELETAIGQLGASINMYTSSEYITLSANCLTRNYNDVLKLVEEILFEPRWDEKEFDRLKQSTINGIVQSSANPNAIGRNVFNKLIYGKDHIRSYPTSGTIESVESITMDDLKAFYEKYFSPSVAKFHIAGNITKEEAIKSLETLNSEWVAKEITIPEYDVPTTLGENRLFFIDVPDAKQSVITVGGLAMPRNDESYYPADMANYKLGSGSGARLFGVLRLEKGYTYGAYSSFSGAIHTGSFAASSSVQSAVTLEAVNIFNDILTNYKDTYTAEDLENTKSALIRQNAGRFETIGSLIGMLQTISTYDLPLDYVKNEESITESMTFEEIKEVIKNHIDQEKMIYVVVGDKKTQFGRLKDAGLGEPVLLDKNAEIIK